MFLNNVPNNADISAIIIEELRNNFNIKYRKEKKQKYNPISGTRRIFHKPLSNLDSTEVTLSTGNVCEVPQFVVDATQRILEDVKVEGLFRKAGSAIRQKEIRDKLEYGQLLDHTHNVIDVANILKYFLRELSESLLPPGNFQETILRCLLCKGSNERRITAIKMVCLLLPQRHLNTLVYLMQFLNVVSQHSNQNKMSIKNLAIIFAPSLMPLLENNGQRLVAHVQIIEILIENAYELGIVPSIILGKIQNIVLAENQDATTAIGSTTYSNDAPPTDSKKKKKRRSGSLTRMFNGIRKIVGAIGISAEDLETTPEIQSSFLPSTPCLTKSTKKRKVLEANAFSNKKRKDVLELLPSGNLLPSTPMCIKPAKKSRLSLGGKRYTKQSEGPVATTSATTTSTRLSHEHRWNADNDNPQRFAHDDSPADIILEPLAKKRLLEDLPLIKQPINENNKKTDESYLKISKSEYEEIKDRVSAIETRISREFTKLQSSLVNDSMDSIDMLETEHLNGPEKVLDKYERALEETEMINSSPSTEQLANRLSRGLKIRRSAEQKVFRSPSARKIGNIRRRSQENIRLSRNKSWHLGNNCAPKDTLPVVASMNTDEYFMQTITTMTTAGTTTVTATAMPSGRMQSSNTFYPSKITAKRTQTATVTNQFPSPMKQQQIPLDDKTNNIPVDNDQLDAENTQASAQTTSSSSTRRALDFQLQNEKWVCADIFFDDSMSPSNFSSPSRRKRTRDRKTSDNECENTPNITPRSSNSVLISDSIKTPMLPPRLTSVKKSVATNSVQRIPYPRPSLTKTHLTPLMQQDYHQQGGRASIARLRSQNAGMVLAKAKLFDELGTDLRNNGHAKTAIRKEDHHTNQSSQLNAIGMRNNAMMENYQTQSPSRKIAPRKQQPNGRNSPSGLQRRQNFRHLNYTPIKKSPLAMKTTVLSISDKNATTTAATMESPIIVDTTPHIKRPLSIKNPRRLVRTPQNKRKAVSPLRATTPFKYRNSPRLHAVK